MYTEFQFKMFICDADNEQKPIHIGISKGHNSAANYSTGPIFEVNVPIFVTHLHVYAEFQFNMFICDADNERKPIYSYIGIFLIPNGIALPKIIRPDPYSKSTCLVFS